MSNNTSSFPQPTPGLPTHSDPITLLQLAPLMITMRPIPTSRPLDPTGVNEAMVHAIINDVLNMLEDEEYIVEEPDGSQKEGEVSNDTATMEGAMDIIASTFEDATEKELQ